VSSSWWRGEATAAWRERNNSKVLEWRATWRGGTVYEDKEDPAWLKLWGEHIRYQQQIAQKVGMRVEDEPIWTGRDWQTIWLAVSKWHRNMLREERYHAIHDTIWRQKLWREKEEVEAIWSESYGSGRGGGTSRKRGAGKMEGELHGVELGL
jgi:hypothetical protein